MDRRAALKRFAPQEDGPGLIRHALELGVVIFSVWPLIHLSGLGADIAYLFSLVTAQTMAV
jgi:hypothetical protein